MLSTTSTGEQGLPTKTPGDDRRTTRWLALGAVAGPIVFTLAWLVLGFVSPGYTLFGTHIAPYSPISQPFSGLGLGVTAPYMNAAFVISGLLIVVGAVGIFQNIQGLGAFARRSGATLLALSGLGLVIDGFFTLEAMMLHLTGFLVGIGSLLLGFPVVGFALRRNQRWPRLGTGLLLASPLTLALLVLFFATFDPVASGTGAGMAGLTERVLVLEAHGWLVALGWASFRDRSGVGSGERVNR